MRSIFLVLTALSGIVAVPLPRNSAGSSFSHPPSVWLAELLKRQTGEQPDQKTGEQTGSPRGGLGDQSEETLYILRPGRPAVQGNFPPIDYSLFEIKCDEVPYDKVRSLDID